MPCDHRCRLAQSQQPLSAHALELTTIDGGGREGRYLVTRQYTTDKDRLISRGPTQLGTDSVPLTTGWLKLS